MTKPQPLVLKGKPGHWVAVSSDNKVVAEARTLQAVAKKAEDKGAKYPVFARIPRANCTLIL